MKGNKWVPWKDLADVGDASQCCMILQELYSIVRYQGGSLGPLKRHGPFKDMIKIPGGRVGPWKTTAS